MAPQYNVDDVFIREATCLLAAWWGSWAGDEFDGRDTWRLWERLCHWRERAVADASTLEFTECSRWYIRTMDADWHGVKAVVNLARGRV